MSSPDNLDKLVKRAHTQISERYKKYGGVGLVSISISKLVYIASTTNENGNQREEFCADFQDIPQRMRLLVGKFSQMFKLAFGNLGPKCVGLLMHYKMPFVDSKTDAMNGSVNPGQD